MFTGIVEEVGRVTTDRSKRRKPQDHDFGKKCSAGVRNGAQRGGQWRVPDCSRYQTRIVLRGPGAGDLGANLVLRGFSQERWSIWNCP